jgi:hypothetical protein
MLLVNRGNQRKICENLFVLRDRRELGCVWCGMLKNFAGQVQNSSESFESF